MATLFRSMTICFVYVYLTSMLGIDAEDTLWPYQFLRNGQTLTSPNQRFELGFFNVSYKKHPCGDLWYLGIWYREIKPLTVVWVANRVDPLHDGGGLKLVLNSVGDLLLQQDAKNMTWINRVNQPVTSPALVLLDSGNLVIKDGKNVSDKRYIWQSFNFPSDTLLPGMKLGRDLKDGTERVLTSWRTSKDPSYGEFVFKIESIQSPQLLLEKNVITQSRWGPWDGHGFSGIYAMKDNHVFMPVYHSSLEEVYFTFKMLDDSMLLRLVVNRIGTIQFLKWKNSSRVWVPMVTLNKDICDSYGSCGPYGICYANAPGCRCLEGFMANSPEDWRRSDHTAGCRRENALNCSGGDGFVKHKGLKLPDNFTVWQGLSPQQCGDYCLEECSCVAYTNIDIYGNGSKCVVWLDKLLDIRDSPRGGNALYIRMARGDLVPLSSMWQIQIVCEYSSARKMIAFCLLVKEDMSKLNLEVLSSHLLQQVFFVEGCSGYMSPEYMLDGHYSIKSDMFSFGVLALEIISGQKNWGFQHPDHEFNLLGHAWMLWIERKDLELMDPILEESFLENEIKRCIQVGLLCVQHSAEKRPTMSQVVSMLLNEDVKLLEPQEPGFFSQISNGVFGSSSTGFGLKFHTDNGLTITALTGRS